MKRKNRYEFLLSKQNPDDIYVRYYQQRREFIEKILEREAAAKEKEKVAAEIAAKIKKILN